MTALWWRKTLPALRAARRIRLKMADTQWPRFQVFVQSQEGEPHHHAGSVHAPDTEIALLNARDVFVRRPTCTSIWLVPADKITALTTGNAGLQVDNPPENHEMQAYYIFRKLKPADGLSEAGLITARSPQEALASAIHHFSDTEDESRQTSLWWAFPVRAVFHSTAAERESMFQPALDKPFRMSTDFKTHTMMRQLKNRSHP